MDGLGRIEAEGVRKRGAFIQEHDGCYAIYVYLHYFSKGLIEFTFIAFVDLINTRRE